jgi:hypothetical protein
LGLGFGTGLGLDNNDDQEPSKVRVLLGGHSRKYQTENLRSVSSISIHDKYRQGNDYQIIQEWPEELVLAKRMQIIENDFAILTLAAKVGDK